MLRRLLRRSLTTTNPPLPPPPPPLASDVDPTSSLTLYFLKKSCGLSPSAALSAAAKLRLKTTKKPHSVLTLFLSHGFTKPQIARLVSRRPNLLLSSASATLQPKLRLLLSLQLPTSLLADHPDFLLASLPHRLAPNIALLRSLLPTAPLLVAALKSSPSLLLCDHSKHIVPKLAALRAHGVPDPVLSKLLAAHPRCLIERTNHFDKALSSIVSIGVNPSSTMFAHALGVLSKIPDAVWERKMENFRSLGWSPDEALRAFAKHPYCMSASDEKVKKSMEFYVGELGWNPAYVAANPALLSFSFDNRVVPRCLVLRILGSKGLFKGNVGACHLSMGQKEFLKKYVEKYRTQVPEVVDAMSGKIRWVDLNKESEEIVAS